MPEVMKQTQVFRFDQMAVQVKDKVEPAEANVDRYVGLEHIDPESLKIRRWGETSDVESSKIIFKSGDIIFGKRRAYQRKLAVADFEGICSAHAMVLRPKTDVVLEEFLPFFMQSDIFMDRAVKISVGGLSPTINWRDLAEEEFALPPLEEQRRIAELLKSSSENTNALFDLATRTEELLDSLILESLEIQSIARTEGYKGGFELKTGGEIYTARSGNGEPTFTVDGDTLFFKVADFNRNADHRSLSVADTRFNSQENPSIRVFPQGTVVFPKRGASIFLNKIGVLSYPAALDPNLMALEPEPDCTSAEFLMWFFKGVGLWRFADTTSVPQLNHKHLKPVPVPLPSLAEQDVLTGKLSKIADALANSRQRLEGSKQFADTLLKESLRGAV
jgi:type I restriction enzyme, S subunit